METVIVTLESVLRKLPVNNGATEPINGREGETATLLKRSLVFLTLRVFGFAPRQRRRYTSFVMSRIVRWETQFTDAFYPSVVLLATPFPLFSGRGVGAKVVVAPDGIDKYPKYLVDFGEVIVFTSMDEGCCPERDFSSATFDEAITSAKFVCSMQWLNSPWLKSYEGCHDPIQRRQIFTLLDIWRRL